MARIENQRLKIIYLAQIFFEQSDEQHMLSMNDLLEHLRIYGIEAERKSIYADIAALQEYGMDINIQRGRNGGYFLASRSFELPELKLLVDAVQSSRFITHRKSNELINKVEALTSIHQARALQRQVFVAGRIKTMNESIYYNVDRLHVAIHAGKQIRFHYFEWKIDFSGTERIVKQYRKNGQDYIISPWALAWDDENYYLIGFDAEADCIKHYRVDKMENIRMTDFSRIGQKHFDHFDMGVYAKKTFGMFRGVECTVTLCCENRFIGVIRDRFGIDVLLTPSDDAHFIISVQVAVSPQFFSWVFGLGGGAQIIGPPNVLEGYREQLKKSLEQI